MEVVNKEIPTDLSQTGGVVNVPDRLTVLTYNIWNSPYQNEERTRSVSREIRELKADLVALQEVSPTSMEVVFEDLSDFYHVIENFRSTGADHGVVILADRKKFKVVEPYRFDFTECTSDSRHILGVKVEIVGLKGAEGEMGKGEAEEAGERLDFITTHLESNASNDHLRKRQRAILDRVSKNEELEKNVIVAGTFNGYKSHERQSELGGKYRDVWTSLGCSPSLRNTFEGGVNSHLSEVKFKGRLDKIFVRDGGGGGSKYKEESLALIGVDTKNSEAPSDHYGLWCLFGIGRK